MPCSTLPIGVLFDLFAPREAQEGTETHITSKALPWKLTLHYTQVSSVFLIESALTM